MAGMEMDPETSLRLFEEGATFIFTDVPPGTEIGIDLQSWNAGEKFKGIKMIPPGLHFIYFSAVNKEGNVAPRTGFFQIFEKRQVLVKKYDPSIEDICETEVSEDTIIRLASDLKSLDPHLGPYPYDVWKKWISITNRITSETLAQLLPPGGKILSSPKLMTQDLPTTTDEGSEVKKEDITTEHLQMAEDASCKINYTPIPTRSYPDGASPAEISKHSMDCSYKFELLLSSYKTPTDFLAELQFAYVNFLVGHSYTSFEQWKEFVKLIAFSESAISKYPHIYSDFLSDLYFQMSNTDTDFFADVGENNNFMHACVQRLQRNILECDNIDSRLSSKIDKFCNFLNEKFGWVLEYQECPEDEQPVVVEL